MGFASESSGIGTAGRGLSFGFATRCFSGNMAYDMMVIARELILRPWTDCERQAL